MQGITLFEKRNQIPKQKCLHTFKINREQYDKIEKIPPHPNFKSLFYSENYFKTRQKYVLQNEQTSVWCQTCSTMFLLILWMIKLVLMYIEIGSIFAILIPLVQGVPDGLVQKESATAVTMFFFYFKEWYAPLPCIKN